MTDTPWTKGREIKRAGSTLYALEPFGWRRGEEQFRNRWSAHVQPGPETPASECEDVARALAVSLEALHLLARIDPKLRAMSKATGSSEVEALASEASTLLARAKGEEQHTQQTTKGA